MRFESPTAARQRHAGAALAVLAAHALLLAVWLQARAPTRPPVTAVESLAWLWLLQPAAPARPDGAARGARPEPATRAAVPRAITPPAPDLALAAPTAAEASRRAPATAVPPATGAAADAPPATAAAPPAAAASAPLDLRLPRDPQAPWRQRLPALDDPRSNTRAPAGIEARIATVLGDGRWLVERLDHDRVRYRSGERCVVATRSRAGQLDLGGGAFRDLWALREC